MWEYLYPYINNRLLAPACPPQMHGWYNLEWTIHAPGSHSCHQSIVSTRRKNQYMPGVTLAQQKIFTGHCCPECVRDLLVPTMFRQF
ncbi:hypothetical protein T03_12222 [Trichinella britovi]|uniref:Uncharacterized protein n=1 Tax=Trichinella britovi TaxID=45882 RepID=A0A0V1AHS0_TRIBR|nr:hypothetical protein T03_12222 [Trichinella britovi]